MRQVRELLEALGDAVQLRRLRKRVAESSSHQRMGAKRVHKIVILGVAVQRRAVHIALGATLADQISDEVHGAEHPRRKPPSSEHVHQQDRGEQDSDPNQLPRPHLSEIHPDHYNEPEDDLDPRDPAIVAKSPAMSSGNVSSAHRSCRARGR